MIQVYKEAFKARATSLRARRVADFDFEQNFVSRYYSLFRKLQTLQMIN
jgi:hypothetical protein